ncbi:GRAM domain-containing protein 2B-like isoform X2 [Acipenser oxyrinchus oxyrinchus]|uniref:GRAM domain-containing protein 2B-like isoform X2 n=1 Tax=Acipenser oxyrinchus oxyrinchus TaxID=40147 RepID=A0AAD8CJJ1_ACIOX|nr:GRAM domain-containing protein 2B-like isoform X2 [Acipenser oxyrinchus oxyrinchus]
MDKGRFPRFRYSSLDIPHSVLVEELDETAEHSQVESEVNSEKLKKEKMMMGLQKKSQSLEEAQLAIQHRDKHQPLNRSQTFDLASTKNDEQEKSLEWKGSLTSSLSKSSQSYSKHNKSFHKLFREIAEEEPLMNSFTCALQKEFLYHGKMYVSNNYICFYSSVLLKETKVVIPVSSVAILKKQNTALVVPNALSIRTTDGEKARIILLQRNAALWNVTFKLLKSICYPSEDASTNSSPVFSSAETSFDTPGKHLNSSQSSLDQEQETQLDSLGTPKHSKAPSQQLNTIHSQLNSEDKGEDQTDRAVEQQAGDSWVWTITRKVNSYIMLHESSSINMLLIIYLLLVVVLLLSSGYIGLRIVALEQQLTSMGAWPDVSMHRRYKDA